MSVTFALLVAAIVLGNAWWKSEASSYSEYIYKPLTMQPALREGNVLDLQLRDPGWLSNRKLDDFIPDHDHLMHLYMIRWPQMDVVYHLHPEPVATGEFQLPLPSVPAGTYHLYADVVHAAGFPETIVGNITVPSIAGRPLQGDDAEGMAAPVGATDRDAQRFTLPDGYTMVWKKPAKLTPKSAEDFEFELLDPQGKPPGRHGALHGNAGACGLREDRRLGVRAHPSHRDGGDGGVHDGESAVVRLWNESRRPHEHAGMGMGHDTLPNTVSFPYGFPTAGQYRIFVQMKHGNVIETGAFDARVNAPAK